MLDNRQRKVLLELLHYKDEDVVVTLLHGKTLMTVNVNSKEFLNKLDNGSDRAISDYLLDNRVRESVLLDAGDDKLSFIYINGEKRRYYTDGNRVFSVAESILSAFTGILNLLRRKYESISNISQRWGNRIR